MAHPPESRAAVRRLYVVDRQPLEVAAERVGVPHSTARKWKNVDAASGDDWDRARAASALSSSGASTVAQLVLHDFLVLHQATVEALSADGTISPLARAEAMSRLADAFTKTISAVAKAAPDLGAFAVATEILQMQADFVRTHYPQHIEAFLEVLPPFGTVLAQRFER
jgi:Protein of unknown function (DUF1804)